MYTKKLGASHIKIENRKLVFAHIFNQPGITRPQITNHTKLSSASVGRITDELIAEGLIEEYESDIRNVGRRPSLLQTCGKNVPALAVELDRSRQVCAAVDLTGKVHYRIERDFNVFNYNPEEVCGFVREMADEVMSQPNFINKRFSGICVVMPGLIDIESGTVVLASQFRWHDIPLGTTLKDFFPDMPVELDNDMNARALAESLYGELRHEQNAVVLGIGTGVGAGIIANGHVYRGDSNMAGEVGHIPMDSNGKMCECGSYGCLQTYVADWALLDDARQFRHDADINAILSAARRNEQWAISIIDRFAQYTANAVSYITGLLNPGAVVLTGSLLEDYPALSERLLNDHPSQIRGSLRKPLRLAMSSLGRDGAIIGAGVHLLHKVYSEYI